MYFVEIFFTIVWYFNIQFGNCAKLNISVIFIDVQSPVKLSILHLSKKFPLTTKFLQNITTRMIKKVNRKFVETKNQRKLWWKALKHKNSIIKSRNRRAMMQSYCALCVCDSILDQLPLMLFLFGFCFMHCVFVHFFSWSSSIASDWELSFYLRFSHLTTPFAHFLFPSFCYHFACAFLPSSNWEEKKCNNHFIAKNEKIEDTENREIWITQQYMNIKNVVHEN